MTTFEKAMAGDEKAIERYFFNSRGGTRSDAEFAVIFNSTIDYREKLRRVAAMRESNRPTARNRNTTTAAMHVPFELLLSQTDAIHAKSFGIRLD